MTEAEWARCRDPDELLDYHAWKGEKRRLRLLAAACARRMWGSVGEHLQNPAFEQLLAVVERYADGDADREEFIAVRKPFRQAVRELSKKRPDRVETAVRVLECLTHDAMEAMTVVVANAREVARARRREGAAQCELIRCIFGRPAVLTPVCLGHNDGAAAKLAQIICEKRELPSGHLDVAQLAILADVLEESGVEDRAALDHLRTPGLHARGCFVLDACLGRGGRACSSPLQP